MRLEDDAILHAIGALVWGIGLGAVAIAPTFPPFPLQRRAVAQPAKHAPKDRRGAVPGANQASIRCRPVPRPSPCRQDLSGYFNDLPAGESQKGHFLSLQCQ